MKLMRFIGALSVAALLAPVLIGTASADSVSATTTGPNSDQTASFSNSVNFDSTNLNDTVANSQNGQIATSGTTSAQTNTSVGSNGSGVASNGNKAVTVVTNGNPTVLTPGLGDGMSSVTSASSKAPGAYPAATKNVGGMGGSVLGASTTNAAAILPVTGPLVPVDVSAIRAAWHPQNGISPVSLVKHTSAFTAGMLITATLLSLLGAAGSAVYTRRQERRI
jgi:hypothetical protein